MQLVVHQHDSIQKFGDDGVLVAVVGLVDHCELLFCFAVYGGLGDGGCSCVLIGLEVSRRPTEGWIDTDTHRRFERSELSFLRFLVFLYLSGRFRPGILQPLQSIWN
jgi:hypothetical protein